MGVQLWRPAGDAALAQVEGEPEASAREVFGHAALVTALNPKSTVFFVAFAPQFLHPSEPLATQSAILIATFVTLAVVNALGYALLGRPPAARAEASCGAARDDAGRWRRIDGDGGRDGARAARDLSETAR